MVSLHTFVEAFGVFDLLGFGLGPVISGVVRDHAGIDEVFLSMAALMTVGGLLQPLLGPVADRVNRRAMAVAGSAGIAGSYITLALTTDFEVILAAFVLVAGLGAAVIHAAAAAVQVDVGRRLGRATTMSLASMVFAVGTLPGSLGGGVIADRAGVPMVFVLAAASITLGALFFALRTRGRLLPPTGSQPAPSAGAPDVAS